MARDPVDLQSLRLFARISGVRSFTEAAALTGVAQPTVSRVVKQLEDAWGGQLFYRTPKGVTLSELGEVALNRVEALLREVDQVSEDLRSASGLPSGSVALGISPSLAPVLIPRLVNELQQDAPGIRLQIHEGFSNQIEAWRTAGVVDLGIFSSFNEGGKVDDGALFASQLVLAASSGEPPLPPEITFAELATYPLVMPSLPNGLRSLCEEIARRQSLTLNVAVETESTIVQKQVCAHCGCYTVKAPETIADEIAAGVYSAAIIVKPTIQRQISLATTRQRPLSRAAREVAGRATEMLRQLSP